MSEAILRTCIERATDIVWDIDNKPDMLSKDNSAVMGIRGVAESIEASLKNELDRLTTPPAPQAGEIERAARIIDPITFNCYDREVAVGRIAENGRPWADVCYGQRLDELRKTAAAIVAALRAQAPAVGEGGCREALEKILGWIEAGDGDEQIPPKYLAMARAALASHPASGDWQPIETAPKDGTQILCWAAAPYQRAICLRWVDGDWLAVIHIDGKNIWCTSLLTHWMPLPSPPNKATE